MNKVFHKALVMPDFRFLLLGLFTLLLSCRDDNKAQMKYLTPVDKNINLNTTGDTLVFNLPADSYNRIRSFNYFIDHENEYISFYDKQSASVNLYEFNSGALIKRIPLKSYLPHRKFEKYTTVYYKNLDSLFVMNGITLYLLNNAMKVTDSFEFQRNPFVAFASFKNGNPPIFLGDKMYTIAKPYLSTQDKKEYIKWRAMYELDLKNNTTELKYRMPQVYQDSLLGYNFFETSYCFNNKGKIVFSFAADSNIYETDLEGYNTAYHGKSAFQKSSLNAATMAELNDEEDVNKYYLLRDSYGGIYFDPYSKRYLRIAEQKITESEYILGKKEKNKTVLFFDEDLRAIGETKLAGDIELSTILFTRNGHMYIRTGFKAENALYFVRLEYGEGLPENKIASH